MEVVVRTVPGGRSCFVALPLPVIQALERTAAAGSLPAVLALELRGPDGARWRLAWAGAVSASASPDAVEVSQQFAACISLPDSTKASLSAISVLPKAKFVSVEPISEEDWEVLELNSELAEEAILKQVGIIYDGMKFPLWLHGHNVVEFLVISASPSNSIVQLVPGTEVAVAPKKRKGDANSIECAPKQDLLKAQPHKKALLRVQEAGGKYVDRFEYNGIQLGVFVTYAVQIHPDTAVKLSLSNLQLVSITPKFSPKDSTENGKGSDQQIKGSVPGMKKNRHIVVHIILSDSVAKEHIMLPQSIRCYIGTCVHAWVYVQRFSPAVNKNTPSITIRPLHFKMLERNSDNNSALDCQEQDIFPTLGEISLADDPLADDNISMSRGFNDITAAANWEESVKLKQERSFIRSWLIGQLKGISSHIAQPELNTVLLPSETLLHFQVIDQSRGGPVDLIYLLTTTSDFGVKHKKNELVTATEYGIDNFEQALQKLELNKAISLDSTMERARKFFDRGLSSLSWLENEFSDIEKRLSVLLSSASLKLLSRIKCPYPGNVLVYGPPGSGKTTLCKAVARHFEEHKEILAHVVYVDCSKLATEKNKKQLQQIADYIYEAIVHSPSVVIFDDLDSLISFSPDNLKSQSSNSSAIVKYLIDMLDEYRDKSHGMCGYGPVSFLASAKSLKCLPQELTSSGRFDLHVQVPGLSVSARIEILRQTIVKLHLLCSAEIISNIASKCDGYDAYDLEILVDNAVLAASDRLLGSSTVNLVEEDFLKAMRNFSPVAMRDISKFSPEISNGWEDVGGLSEVVNIIKETIELPLKYPKFFVGAPVRLRSNILLYGPTGCGKTHVVKSVAAAYSLRFIPIKGPELMNMYIGSTEQYVRDTFAKAAAAAPCLLFFDEFESLVPQRGKHGTQVTDRVVNQFLTELDGVEALTGVFVFAATNKPREIDAALLRPGRFDRLVFCDFPQKNERLDILRVLSKELPLASDADLELVASMTEGFSGADLKAILTDAGLEAAKEAVRCQPGDGIGDIPQELPLIARGTLMSVASEARPSTSEEDRRSLREMFSQFSTSRKSSISTEQKRREANGQGQRVAVAES
ncbi:peroxisome biogenesis protein 1 isoform X3 [Triticum aestivum]|uniref:peroxisome biogenesis protein 1 isoform X3 n=1 Tax=Triticum aestivum TaxID=4565 RepID=UPI001D035E39|nr:peroxisome biogenesis protein 1-like isoform X3 [Triticum aestivum]